MSEIKSDFEKLLLARAYIKVLKQENEELKRIQDDPMKPLKIEIGKLQAYIDELEDENKKLKEIKSQKEQPIQNITLLMDKMTPEERIYFREKEYLKQIEALKDKIKNQKEHYKNTFYTTRRLKIEFDIQRVDLLNTILHLRKELDDRRD